MYCQNCGTQLSDGDKFCPNCGQSTNVIDARPEYGPDPMASIMVNKKSEGLALILSFFITGLGQIYVGKSVRGAVMLLSQIGLSVLAFVGATMVNPYTMSAGDVIILVAFAGSFILWLFAMYDAYTSAKDYNRLLLENNGQPPW